MCDYDTGHFYLDYQGKVVYDLMIRKPLIQVSGLHHITEFSKWYQWFISLEGMGYWIFSLFFPRLYWK